MAVRKRQRRLEAAVGILILASAGGVVMVDDEVGDVLAKVEMETRKTKEIDELAFETVEPPFHGSSRGAAMVSRLGGARAVPEFGSGRETWLSRVSDVTSFTRSRVVSTTDN